MSRDIEAARAFVRLALSGRAQVEQGLHSLGSRMRSMAGLATKLTAAIGAIGLGAGFISSIKAASDMQETMSKFNVVFGESAEVMKKWGDELASQVGRSKQEIAGFLASSQDLLVPLGFDPQQAQELSKQITQLAIDLGSFNNVADADAFQDLQAALTGSGEVMKKYGVVVNEARVKQELLNMKLDPRFATEAEKAMARFRIILAGTTAAQGDAIRTSDSFANQWKRLQAAILDAKVALGDKFLPLASKLVGEMSEAALAIGNFVTEGVDGFDEVNISAESLLDVIGVIANAFKGVAAVIGMLRSETTKWSAEINEAITEIVKMIPGAAGQALEDTFRETAKEQREEEERLRNKSQQMLDTDYRQKFKDELREQREERAKMREDETQGESIMMSPETHPEIYGTHPDLLPKAPPPPSASPAFMERQFDLLRGIEQNTRQMISSMEANFENTVEAARAERENDANALLAKEVEEQKKQTALLRQAVLTLQNVGPIGIIRGPI